MKRPYPDVGSLATGSYITKVAYVRKFVRYWGTTWINGEEVLVKRKYYYKSMDDSTVKLTKLIGAYNNLKDANMKGIKNAWLYLNPTKSGVIDFDKDILKANLNTALENLPSNLQLVIGPKVAKSGYRRNPANLTAPILDTPLGMQEELIAEVKEKYSNYFYSEYLISTNVEDDVYLSILLKYILLSGDVDYTVTRVSKGYSVMQIPSTYSKYNDATESFESVITYSTKKVDTYIIDIDIHSLSIASNDSILDTISSDANKGVDDAGGSVNTVVVRSGIDSDYEEMETRTYTSFPFDDKDNFWVTVEESTLVTSYYLKKSVLTGSTLSWEQKVELINSIIDSDYKKKSVPAWKTLVAIAIFIAVVYFSGGKLIKEAAGALATIVAVATAISLGALALSLFSLLAMSMGYEGLAAASANFLKTIDPLVQIAGVIAIVGSLAALAENGARELVAQASADAAGQVTREMAIEYLKSNIVASVIQGIKSMAIASLSSVTTNISMESAVKLVSILFKTYTDYQIESVQGKIKDEKAKLAQIEQDEEESRSRDIARSFSRIQFSPMTSDNSYYSMLFDKPYEPWSSNMHTGNIQCNYVNALWLSK